MVSSFNPLTDSRWPGFLADHPEASVFHTREWLSAIQRTYAYEPIAFTTSQGGELRNAVLFCQVNSWLTGKRLVSLPFSDHCQPLAVGDELDSILTHIQNQCLSRRQKYVEFRPLPGRHAPALRAGFHQSEAFSFQSIDLQPELEAIYKGFHDSCIRRKIKKAEKEKLSYEAGQSPELLRHFRHLLLITRRRHKLPPQPAAWFENIMGCLGPMATIHLVSKDQMPAASIVTLTYKTKLVYKYGCSDGRFNSLGGTPFLFWKAIQKAKENGILEFDLGRSGIDDKGLIEFKRHLGAGHSELNYYRNIKIKPPKNVIEPAVSLSRLAREALVRLPDSLLAGVGELMYRHIG